MNRETWKSFRLGLIKKANKRGTCFTSSEGVELDAVHIKLFVN